MSGGVERRHVYELRPMEPAALVFNLAALGCLLVFPGYVPAVVLGSLSAPFSLRALADCMRNFRARSALMAWLFRASHH